MTDELPVTERRPELEKLLRSEELSHCLLPLLTDSCVRAVDLFEMDGSLLCRLASPSQQGLPVWKAIPDRAKTLLAQRRYERTALRWRDMPFELRTLMAGADRVGIVLYTLTQQPESQPTDTRDADFLEGVHRVLQTLTHSGYATWVTSELHLAASESSYRVLESQHAELKRAVEHLREVDKLKSNFLATISHELRTPLTSVIGFAEMLLKEIAGPLNAEQREYAVTIFERGDELLRLISQLLDMSRMDSGPPRVHLDACSIEEIIRKAMRTVQIEAERAKVAIEFDTGGDPLPPVHADDAKIRQILINLLGNAIKFSPADSKVRITAALGPRRRPFAGDTMFGEEEDDALLVTVSDAGMGIPADHLDKIFEAFYQVNSSATRKHGGAGLGLSIVRKLVEAHHGEIWVDSTPGKGTSFSFTIPLDQEVAAQATHRRHAIGS